MLLCPKPKRDIEPEDLITGLEKGLHLLESMSAPPGRWTVSEAALLGSLSRASARRFLLTLAHIGYVESDGKHYWLTPRTLRVGEAYLSSSKLARTVHAVVERVGYLAQESASVGVLDENDVVYIARSSVARIVSITLRPGSRVPLYCTAGGRVLLAAMEPPACRARLAGLELKPLTPYTKTDLAQINKELVQIRGRGYALVDQEFEVGMRTLSVPMFRAAGEVAGVISLTSHAQRGGVEPLVTSQLPILLEAQSLLRGLI
jgi:IclR family transcriptional regulator, pca regulon regulatory protein